nr:hypothetical protein [Providencia rettgeri]
MPPVMPHTSVTRLGHSHRLAAGWSEYPVWYGISAAHTHTPSTFTAPPVRTLSDPSHTDTLSPP